MGTVKGTYRMADQTKAVDISNAYMLVMEEERLVELEAIIRDFKAKTTQEAIFLEVQYNVEVRFI